MATTIFYPLGSAQAEELALRAGLKPAIRQQLTPRALPAQRRRFARLGYACDQVELGDAIVLVIARDAARAAEGARLARAQHEGGHAERLEAVLRQGELLGYPTCCAESFARHHVEHVGTLPACRAALSATRGALAPRLNTLDPAMFHYLPWLPCRFDCPASVEYADAIAALIARRYPVFIRKIDYALGAHRLTVGPRVQLSLRGLWRGAALVVGRAWSTAADRRPGSVERPADARLAAELVAQIARRPLLEVSDGALLLGGREVLRRRGLTLFPFGGRPPR